MGYFLQAYYRVLLFSGLLLIAVCPLQGVTVSGNSGMTVTVYENGLYEIVAGNPPWRFAGSLGALPLNVSSQSGSDAAGGPYSEISFDFRSDAPRHASIRTYFNTPAVLFTMTLPSGGPNTFSFPDLAGFPQGLSHIAYDGTFADPTFMAWNDESPWISFDWARNTVILSPASHFMVARTAVLPAGDLVSGISPQISSLPAGFTHQALLVVENGINRAFSDWGNLLTGITGKTRPANDADVTLNKLGYWTDAGANYYYEHANGMSYPGTLAAVQQQFAQQGLPLGYLQLDSWFYPKGPAADWQNKSAGIYQYIAASPVFASSLAAFQNSLGIPLVTHARWIDPSSPYWSQYQMSGTVSIDPLFWASVAGYLSGSGAAAFEQDWLADKAVTAYNLTDGDAFLGNMAAAMAQQNLNIQYCSGTARHFLQSAQYSNVTTIRASMDRFDSTRWSSFLYAGRLASAVGVWPFTDVFMSGETGNLLMATLSAGPVGVGDPLGGLNAGNLRRAVRADGVIVKPDVPLTPLDSSFWNDSQDADAPMIAATYSDFGELRGWYFFLYAQGATTQAQFRLTDAGVNPNRPVYLYDHFAGTGQVVRPDELLTEDVSQNRYLVGAPIGPSGMALLGDTGQFVTLGKKRVTALSDDGALHVRLAFAPGETARTLQGYSPDAPSVAASDGAAALSGYDSTTRIFTVTVWPGPDGAAAVDLTREQPKFRRPR